MSDSISFPESQTIGDFFDLHDYYFLSGFLFFPLIGEVDSAS